MLHLYAIKLNQASKDYQRCFILLYCLAGGFLLFSIYPVLIILLLWMAFYYFSPTPHADFQKLAFEKGQWVLYDKKSHFFVFNQAHILVNTGFFLLIALKNKRKTKKIIIFHDQLDTDQLNRLLILVKLTLKSAKGQRC